MNRRIPALHVIGATVLLNGAFVPAALAAWDLPPDGWSALLIGSLVVLAVASVLQLRTGRRNPEPARPAFGSRFFGPQLYPQSRDDQDTLPSH